MRLLRKAALVVAGVALAITALAGYQSLPIDRTTEVPRLFELLELKPGMTMGDIGAGRGEMTVEMARRLGSSGRVYSTDVDKNRLADIRAAAVRESLDNVVVLEGGDQSINLPDDCCDAILLRDVYHHFAHPAEIDASIVRALKPGGRLALIDFEPTSKIPTPPGVPANRGGHGIPPGILREEVSGAGLRWEQTIIGWYQHLYLELFRKPA